MANGFGSYRNTSTGGQAATRAIARAIARAGNAPMPHCVAASLHRRAASSPYRRGGAAVGADGSIVAAFALMFDGIVQ